MEEDATKLELTSQGVGTYWYLPPECFQSSSENPLISTKVDIWSIGVIYYEMLFGCKPFGNQMSQEKILQDKIILKSNGVVFPNTPNVSSEAKELILKCLEYDQNKRIDIESLSECGYLKKNKKGGASAK
jgi:tousled-like kinase